MAKKKAPVKSAAPEVVNAEFESERVERLGQIEEVVNAAGLTNGMTSDEIAARLNAAAHSLGYE